MKSTRVKYRLNLARKHSRTFFGTNQKRIATGLSICNENLGKVEQTCLQMHYDILGNNFDATLIKYGLGKQTQLTVVEGIKKKMSLLELYDWYCESRKGILSETHLEVHLKRDFRKVIVKVINVVGENDAIAIRQYLIENISLNVTRDILSHLDRAHQLGIKHKGITNNPFAGMAEEINVNKQKKQDNYDNENEDSDKRAFTIDEMNAIIEAFESSNRVQHYAPIIKLLFWTGCRTSEAIALKWRDIKWDNELITFRRTYNHILKIFKPTKTATIRFFPMPKDGELWNILKSIPEGNPDDTIFKSKQGKIIIIKTLQNLWTGRTPKTRLGIIPMLVKQGKIKGYLKLYATRHTFVSIQVNVFGIPPEVIAQWCGHDEKVSKKSYL